MHQLRKTIVGSENGVLPDHHQTIISTKVGILLIGLLGTYFNDILIKIDQLSCKKIIMKMSSANWWPCRLGLNVLPTQAMR